jgi:hypothetical protein
MAVPFGDGGTALQAVLDDITVNPEYDHRAHRPCGIKHVRDL